MTQFVLLKGGPRGLDGAVREVNTSKPDTAFFQMGKPFVYYQPTGKTDEASGLPVWKRTKGPAPRRTEGKR